MPEVMSGMMARLLESEKIHLPHVLGSTLSHCLADRSDVLYKDLVQTLAKFGAQLAHGSQSPTVRLAGGEEISLILPMAGQVRYMELRGREVTGAARAQLAELAPGGPNSSDLKKLLQLLFFDEHDRKLQAEGFTLEFYWDSGDVMQAALGMAAFYTTEGLFDHNLFQNDRSFVHCLLGAGWLGPIKMLPPHQAEFCQLLAGHFGVKSYGRPPGGALQFIRDSGLNHSHIITLSSLSDVPPSKLTEIIHEQAGNAPTLFKVTHCISGTWETRLASWVRSAFLKTPNDEYDYDALASSQEFSLLRASFDQHRPKLNVNNFADAMALCMLVSRVRAYKEGKSSRIPYFWASHRLYHTVLQETGLEHALQYQRGGRVVPVLRDHDYYMLRAAIHPPLTLLSTPQVADFSRFRQRSPRPPQ